MCVCGGGTRFHVAQASLDLSIQQRLTEAGFELLILLSAVIIGTHYLIFLA